MKRTSRREIRRLVDREFETRGSYPRYGSGGYHPEERNPRHSLIDARRIVRTVEALCNEDDNQRFRHLDSLGQASYAHDEEAQIALSVYNDLAGPPNKTAAQPTDAPAVPNFAYFLLHLFLPRQDRAVVLRDLEEQFEEEAHDPRLGPGSAKLFYCTRTIANLAWYAWDGALRRPTKRTAIVAAALALLKKLGVISAIAAALKKVFPPCL